VAGMLSGPNDNFRVINGLAAGRRFCIETLGCKVNQYESGQIAQWLLARGWRQVEPTEAADVRIVNTCSVTIQAVSKSRQSARRLARLGSSNSPSADAGLPGTCRILVLGCWATSDGAEVRSIKGVDAVVGHHGDVGAELEQLFSSWEAEGQRPKTKGQPPQEEHRVPDHDGETGVRCPVSPSFPSHQRAILKVQDGCDAGCTYCIVPRLRRRMWSKSTEDAVAEAQRLVDGGHLELVLSGIHLGAYGHPTALRIHQESAGQSPLAALVEALCRRVKGLRRLRLSSLESGDISPELLQTLVSFPQVTPHFHLPLQSGSDRILSRMNRQYRRDDFLEMVRLLEEAFDRPALTTDVIVGFPSETREDFDLTLGVVQEAKFIQVHAFHFSPRPGTAAARWHDQFIRGPVVNHRIGLLRKETAAQNLRFRQSFLGQEVEVLVEGLSAQEQEGGVFAGLRHGRCERYFSVHFQAQGMTTGQLARLRVERVTSRATFGCRV